MGNACAASVPSNNPIYHKGDRKAAFFVWAPCPKSKWWAIKKITDFRAHIALRVKKFVFFVIIE